MQVNVRSDKQSLFQFTVDWNPKRECLIKHRDDCYHCQSLCDTRAILSGARCTSKPPILLTNIVVQVTVEGRDICLQISWRAEMNLTIRSQFGKWGSCTRRARQQVRFIRYSALRYTLWYYVTLSVTCDIYQEQIMNCTQTSPWRNILFRRIYDGNKCKVTSNEKNFF
jgi:hypothetical protein